MTTPILRFFSGTPRLCLFTHTPTIKHRREEGFIRVYDEIRYLVLLGTEKTDTIYNKIKPKGDITYVISHNSVKIKTLSNDSLSLEKTLTFHNVTILIKSVFIRIKMIIITI